MRLGPVEGRGKGSVVQFGAGGSAAGLLIELVLCTIFIQCEWVAVFECLLNEALIHSLTPTQRGRERAVDGKLLDRVWVDIC